MTPETFNQVRAAAIADYGRGRKSKWTVLGAGTVHSGRLGAVKIRDQNGTIGIIRQQWEGAEAGMAISGVPSDYTENAAEIAA